MVVAKYVSSLVSSEQTVSPEDSVKHLGDGSTLISSVRFKSVITCCRLANFHTYTEYRLRSVGSAAAVVVSQESVGD